MTLLKEEVFRIMGKYYGNAHYRDAIRLSYSENDLITTTRMLDEINALGYNFSNLYRLTDHEDLRFIPIVLEYFAQFESDLFRNGLLQAFNYRSYSEYTPTLIALYNDSKYESLRFEISNALFDIRNKKYIPLYMEIVTASDYAERPDIVMNILCKFKVKECLPKLMDYLHLYPEKWTFKFLQYAYCFNDDCVIPDILEALNGDDREYRSMAKKALNKILKK